MELSWLHFTIYFVNAADVQLVRWAFKPRKVALLHVIRENCSRELTRVIPEESVYHVTEGFGPHMSETHALRNAGGF